MKRNKTTGTAIITAIKAGEPTNPGPDVPPSEAVVGSVVVVVVMVESVLEDGNFSLDKK